MLKKNHLGCFHIKIPLLSLPEKHFLMSLPELGGYYINVSNLTNLTSTHPIKLHLTESSWVSVWMSVDKTLLHLYNSFLILLLI